MTLINEVRPYLSKLLKNTKIEDVMEKPAVSVKENDDFSVVQEKFVAKHLTHVCVVDNNNKLVGIISQKYLYKAQSPRKMAGDEIEYNPDIIIDGDTFYDKQVLDSYILSKIMNHNPYVLKMNQSLEDAMMAMSKKHLGCIAIVDDNGKLRGLLTDQIIVKFIAGVL